MANWAGITASLGALVRPSSLQPRLSIPSIAQLDWHRLRHDAGITGVVIDKDNCIAKPSEDVLAPDQQLRDSWDTLLRTFGPDNVLVVSNSAGTLAKDPLLLQAESVSRNLRVPVLVHKSPKPGPACVKQVAAHFLLRSSSSSAAPLGALPPPPAPSTHPATPAALQGQVVFSPLARRLAPPPPSPSPSSSSPTPIPTPRTPRLLVIGDRLATDMILSHRLARLPLPLSLPSSPSSSPSRSRLSRLLALFRSARLSSLGQKDQRIETIAVLTTTLHAREGLGTTLLRTVERAALWGLQRAKRRRVRARGRLAEKGEGTKTEGAEGRTVDEIEWEEFLLPEARARPARVAAPSPAPSRVPPASPAAPALAAAPSPSPSPSSAPLPLSARLRALPASLSRTLSLLPARASAFLASLPPRFSAFLRRTAARASLAAQERVPRALAALHGPMERVVRIYTEPGSLASVPARTEGRQRQSAPALGWTTALAERAVDAVEARVVGPLKGLGALARARAEEVERLRGRLPGLPGRKGEAVKEEAKKEGGKA
ncbi:hypothetical protein JCM10207_000069 [Rhodosporidiobolus poonsookiae]